MGADYRSMRKRAPARCLSVISLIAALLMTALPASGLPTTSSAPMHAQTSLMATPSAVVHAKAAFKKKKAKAKRTRVVGWSAARGAHNSQIALSALSVSGPSARPVKIQKKRSGGKWKTVRKLRTARNGGLDLSFVALRPGKWRVVIPSWRGWKRGTTGQLRIKVQKSPSKTRLPATKPGSPASTPRTNPVAGQEATTTATTTTTTVTKTVTVTAPTIGATFNVRDFGAVGNGTVDDTAAFRAAITAGAGKTVLIPDGTFRISAPVTVPAGTTMTGTGTIHQTSAGRSGLVLSGSGVTVEGVTLLGSRTSNVYAGGEDAIRGAGASTGSPLTNIMIRSVTISGWGAHGVYLQYVKGFTVSGSNVHDVGYAGIGVMSGFDGSISGNRVDNITPGTATNMYGIFLSYSGDGGVTDPPSARVVVDGNTVSRVAWQGINSHAGSNLTITNNHVNACTSGVFIAGTGTTGLIISGNVIDNLADTAPDATGKAILVMGSLAAPASGEINNNIIRRSKWVLLQNTQGLVVSGNTFDRSNPSGILLNGHNTSFAITGNTFTDMWSAAENTAGIDTSSTGYDTGTISGNVLRRGSKTASYINNWGFRLFGAGTGSNVQATNNDFTAATKAPIG